MLNVDVFYYVVSAKGDRIVKMIVLPDMPEPLARELLNGTLRPQMRIFLDNLALLQGYECAEFQLAYEHVEEGAVSDGKTRL